MSNWGMDFEGHVPLYGRRLPEGRYTVEVAANEPGDGTYGDLIRISFKVVEGVEAGGSISTTLYILNSSFTGEFGDAVKDNWYNLLVAAGIKPTNFSDMREVANALVGKRLGVEVVHTKGKGANKDKTYANVQSYIPLAAMGGDAGEPAPTPSTAEPASGGAVDISSIA